MNTWRRVPMAWRFALIALALPLFLYRLLTGSFSVNDPADEFILGALVIPFQILAAIFAR